MAKTVEEVQRATKQANIDDWLRLFLSQTDPDVIAQGRREVEKKQRVEQKRKDVGL